jgi:Acetyltransferase (GNAT) family
LERVRSEYRLAHLVDVDLSAIPVRPDPLVVRHVERDDHEALSHLMLDAYRGSVDDEGESIEDARAAIDHYFETIVWPHSFVIADGDLPVAMSMVVIVDGVHYIDPVATAAVHKTHGLGRIAVTTSLRSLAASGITEVGAVITDGNTPSERLFTRLGFVRVGGWG